MALLGLALAVAGGASRHDEDQQILVRLAAVLAIAATLWPLDLEPLRRRPRLVVALGVGWLLLLLQLVPLPPDLWAALPGHGLYAQIARAAGSVAWRPLSLTPDLTTNAIMALLPATAAAIAVLHLDFRGRTLLAQGVVIVAVASALLGLGQLAAGGSFHLYRETSASSAVGLFANRNHQAAFLALCLPVAAVLAGLRLREGRDPRTVLSVLLGVGSLLLLALLSTGSRMGLVLGLMGTLGAAWCYRAAGGRLLPRSTRARVGVAAAGVMLLTVIALAAARGGVFERFVASDPASEIRAAALKPLSQTAQAFLPLGSGFGSFDSVYRRFEPGTLLSTIYLNQAHNEPLQLAIEGGAPALILLVLFLAWWVWTAVRIVRADLPPVRRAFALAAIVGGAILMASSLVDYPLRTPLLGALFVLGCVEMLRIAAPPSAANDRRDEPARARSAPWG